MPLFNISVVSLREEKADNFVSLKDDERTQTFNMVELSSNDVGGSTDDVAQERNDATIRHEEVFNILNVHI